MRGEPQRLESAASLATVAVQPDPGRRPELLGQERLPPPRRAGEGEPITTHLDGVEVHKALEILTRDTGLNVLVSPNVVGVVTGNIRGLTPAQALAAVLQSTGLVAVQENGVLYVYTPEERDRLERRLPIRIYRLNYVRALDVDRIVRPLLSPIGVLTGSPPSSVGIQPLQPSGGGGAVPVGGAVAASGGAIAATGPAVGLSAGGAGNATGGDSLAGGEVLVVQDREAVLQAVDQIVRELDVQPVQVLIEAVILDVTLNKNRELGVNFAVLSGGGRALTLAGSGAALNAAVGFSPASVLTAGGQVTGTAGAGFAADESGLKFGFVDRDVTGFLRAVENLGKTQVLATPRLLVLNKQRAELQLGDRLGYQTVIQNFTSTIQQVEFLETGTLLRVRPFVSSDGMIRMEIHPERSSGRVVNNVPQTNTSQVTTNVMVPDGATIVIGGLMENVEDSRQFGIPFLSRLPVVGALFRDRVQNTSKRELIVLLTPRIWNPAAVAPHMAQPLSCPIPAPPASPIVRTGLTTSPVLLGVPNALPGKKSD